MSRTDGHTRAHSRAPRWFVDHIWSNAERVRERDDLRRLTQEYNTHQELDDGDFLNRQHRHQALWD